MEIKYFPNYLIYEDGRVWSKSINNFLKLQKSQKGYLIVNLFHDKIRKQNKVHRLVAEHYIPNPENKPEVDHMDRNKLNNNIKNLRWTTHSENQINRPIRGKIPFRHISYIQRFNRYEIKIKRNKEFIFKKSFSKNKFTIIQILTYRDTVVYPKFNIIPD